MRFRRSHAQRTASNGKGRAEEVGPGEVLKRVFPCFWLDENFTPAAASVQTFRIDGKDCAAIDVVGEWWWYEVELDLSVPKPAERLRDTAQGEIGPKG